MIPNIYTYYCLYIEYHRHQNNTVQCTVYTVQCILYIVQCIVQCTSNQGQWSILKETNMRSYFLTTMFTGECTLCNVHCTLYIVHNSTRLCDDSHYAYDSWPTSNNTYRIGMSRAYSSPDSFVLAQRDRER